jgi:hypothetical protein
MTRSGRARGRNDFVGAADFFFISVSYDDGDGAHGTGEFNFRVANGAPTKQPKRLQSVCVRTRLAERLRIDNAQAAQEVLRVIAIGDVLANPKPSARTVLCLVDQI